MTKNATHQKLGQKEQHLIRTISNLRNGLLHVLNSNDFFQQEEAVQEIVDEITNLNNLDSLFDKIKQIDFNTPSTPSITRHDLIQFIQNQYSFNLPDDIKKDLQELEAELEQEDNTLPLKEAQTRYFELNHRITQQLATIRNTDNSIHKTKDNQEYKEGTEQILETDLVIASRNMANNIIKITDKLIETDNSDKDVQQIATEAKQLAQGRAKFFNGIDLLSRVTHHVIKMKADENEKYRQYFLDFQKQIDDAFSILNNQSDLNESDLNHDEAFYNEFHNNMDDFEHLVANTNNIEDLRQAVSHNISTLKENVRQYKIQQEQSRSRSQNEIETLREKVQHLNDQQEEMKKTIEHKNYQLIVDDLTSLHNKIAYERDIEALYQSWNSQLKPSNINIAVVDIDYFKDINDQYGHNVGDLILKEVATKIQRVIGNKGTVYRWGGEEFVIILPDISFQEAIKTTVNARIYLQNRSIEIPNHSCSNITISGGVAPFLSTQDTPRTVFQRADNALYFSKENGRNRISYYSKPK